MLEKKLIKVASFKPASVEYPYSWVGHIPFASWLVKELKPKIFVELGTHSGNSYFSICQTAKENNLKTKCFAIDTWLGDEHAGNYDDKVFQSVSRLNTQEYKSFSKLMRMTFDEALQHFPDRSITLLHIDGLHTYKAVKHDFLTWLPKMSLNGIIIFHDTKVYDKGFGVFKLWRELQTKYPLNFEFDHSHGLGVLQLNKNTKHQWLKSGSRNRDTLREYFSILGSYLKAENEIKKITAERDAQIAERDAQIAERDAQIAERDAQIVAIYQTYSWRISSPLRAMRRLINFFK